jgi:diguanylate cyclase
MSRTSSRHSLRHWSLFAVTWYLIVAASAVLVVAALVKVQAVIPVVPASFWVVALLAVAGELIPVRTSKGTHAPGILLSTAFVFAILYVWGLWPAVLLEAVETLVASLVQRRPPWEAVFRAGAGALAVAVSWLALAAVGLADGLSAAGRELHGVDLLWVFPGWVGWFAADTAIEVFVAKDYGRRLYRAFPADFWYDALTSAAVVALTPPSWSLRTRASGCSRSC